jgi:hypothetical protein
MGCQTQVILGNNLTFSVTTHDPDTGVLTDADAVPDYRIYEDETAAAILTGSMALLDGANTTGFYTELIACTTANGFEVGRSYTIYIEATVDSDQGGITYAFEVVLVSTVFPTGGIDFTYTVFDSVTGLTLDGVEVWFSTDVAGSNIVWKGTTDAFGIARDVNENLPALDAGTYYVWRQRSGYTFANPDTEIVA